MTTQPKKHHQPATNQPAKWSVAVRIFHWISALLLLITWVLITLHENNQGSYIDLHKAFGVSVLAWMVARVIGRLLSTDPAPLPAPTWQKLASSVVHVGLYVLLFAMPISGLLMSWYGGRAVDMFGIFEIPSMLEIDRVRARFFDNLHTEIIWPLLLTFTVIHLLAVVHHQFIKKDGILKRII
ncbi:cytochrome b [Psychrobacter lutiphocae]|uniref:cytochrome b n=1 Tax=Psychrobacter lutiphocae TaxID=540500 RepID=UPI00036C57D7|nr:cytochrome b [Psychrobacter lutiphocae]